MKLILTATTLGLLASFGACDGATPFDKLPQCGTQLFLCDTPDGAWCIDRHAGALCCDDGSGTSPELCLICRHADKRIS
jgi:hypothetical protein